MSRKFKIGKDPLEYGFELYKKGTITIKPGLTVLVGCNGAGKSTLLHSIRSVLKKENIPYMEYDNLKNGGYNAKQENLFNGKMDFLVRQALSSEGENITLNMIQFSYKILEFIKTGTYKGDMKKLAEIIIKATRSSDDKEESNFAEISNERWFLFDAIDSGLSVDNIVDMKEYLFKKMFENACGKDIYILVSANEYEMAKDEQCFDVYNGKYITFKNYEEYRDMILQSREWKENREKARKD